MDNNGEPRVDRCCRTPAARRRPVICGTTRSLRSIHWNHACYLQVTFFVLILSLIFLTAVGGIPTNSRACTRGVQYLEVLVAALRVRGPTSRMRRDAAPKRPPAVRRRPWPLANRSAAPPPSPSAAPSMQAPSPRRSLAKLVKAAARALCGRGLAAPAVLLLLYITATQTTARTKLASSIVELEHTLAAVEHTLLVGPTSDAVAAAAEVSAALRGSLGRAVADAGAAQRASGAHNLPAGVQSIKQHHIVGSDLACAAIDDSPHAPGCQLRCATPRCEHALKVCRERVAGDCVAMNFNCAASDKTDCIATLKTSSVALSSPGASVWVVAYAAPFGVAGRGAGAASLAADHIDPREIPKPALLKDPQRSSASRRPSAGDTGLSRHSSASVVRTTPGVGAKGELGPGFYTVQFACPGASGKFLHIGVPIEFIGGEEGPCWGTATPGGVDPRTMFEAIAFPSATYPNAVALKSLSAAKFLRVGEPGSTTIYRYISCASC